MKDKPFIYVVVNDDGNVEAAFYQKVDAVTYCQKATESFGEDMDEWDGYYVISGVQCE